MTSEELAAKEKYEWCIELARHYYRRDSYREAQYIKKIVDRGFNDDECQRHYDMRLNRLTRGRWQSEQGLIIDRNHPRYSLSGELRPEKWEQVRIFTNKPENCEFVVQGTCPDIGSGCLKWHKKRAAEYRANTVVISNIGSDKPLKDRKHGTLTARGGRIDAELESKTDIALTYPLAEYYQCEKKLPDTKELNGAD